MRSIFRALSALLVAVALPAAAQSTIDKIIFQNPAPYTDAELLTASGLKLGQPLEKMTLPDAAQRLMETGLFADAQATYTAQGTHRIVIITPQPTPLDKLLPVSFENLVWFSPEELAQGLHAAIPLYRGYASDAGTFPDAIQATLQQMLTAKGIAATLSHSVIEPTSQHPQRVVNFTIDKPSIRLGTVHLSITGPTGVATELAPLLRTAITHAGNTDFNEGLAGDTLADRLLAPARNAGYIAASLDHIERSIAPADGGFAVTYTARLNTGDAFKISAVTWNPTPIYSAADFSREATLHPGDLADASALAKTEAPIVIAYRTQGYLDAYLLPTPTRDDAAHTVAYTLTAVPGDQYRLKSVTALNLSPDAKAEFDKGWRMKPGDLYNEIYVQGFVTGNTALMHLARYAGTYQASADPQTHLVDLTLTFTPNSSR